MRYGRGGLSLNLPDDLIVHVIKKRQMPVLKDPTDSIKAAFLSPLGSRPLAEEARGSRDVCILICDNTRPVPNHIILPVLIRGLVDAGLSPSSITILIATGMHRPNEGEELEELIGSEWVLKNINIFNHMAGSDKDHVFLGRTARGMPVKIDRRFVDADLRIVVGLVEPHFMAGYSGGRKVIIPGIAHEDTIRSLHSVGLLNREGVDNCVIDGNPLHEEQIEAVRMIGRCLAINTVIDEDREIAFINFGEIEISHKEAVGFARPYFEVPVNRMYKTVITSSAGYPLDRNYYQTVKGMVGAIDILEPGGHMFVVSGCSEGLGTKDFAESQRRMIEKGADTFIDEALKKEYASIDEWETFMLIKAMKRGSIHLFSEGLTEQERELTGVNIVSSIEEEILRGIKEKGDIHIAVIPEGPYVVPVYRPDKKTI
ncbi:MAG: nickel-dependent lactate racemase [Syntrophorhabdaceae bacterium]|nr:nickel-dependent lactate racemase [Syntrophorhabdaceae bacterium]